MSQSTQRVPILTRVPPAIKKLVEASARANERSTDAEVRALLVRTYTKQESES